MLLDSIDEMQTMAGYVRISKEDAVKQLESESITNQKALLHSYATERGWKIHRIYVDEDYSGVDSKRPSFNQLLEDAEKGKFNVVVCKTQSRFTRDMEAVEKYIHHKFSLWGIRFISIADNADTAVKGNKKARQINGLINEWYLEDLSENIRTVLDHKRISGSYIGSFPVYGYQRNPENHNHLIPDPVAAEVVRTIFDLYLRGWGKNQIAKWLNDKGILSPAAYKRDKYPNYQNPNHKPTSKEWNPTGVGRILAQRMYIGDLVQGKVKKVSYKSNKLLRLPPEDWVIVPDTHEPIIEKHVYFAAQEIRGQRVYEGCSGTGNAHVLTGKVRCGSCGSTMNKNQMCYKGQKKYYLRCKQYCISKDNCTSHSIRLDMLEDEVCRQLRHYITHYYDIRPPQEYLREDRYTIKKKSLQQEIRSLNNKLIQQKTAKSSIYADKASGLITAQEYLDYSQDFTAEIRRVETRLEVIEAELLVLNGEKKNYDEIQRKITETVHFKELTKQMVIDFIDYVEIGEKDPTTKAQEIKIYWMF